MIFLHPGNDGIGCKKPLSLTNQASSQRRSKTLPEQAAKNGVFGAVGGGRKGIRETVVLKHSFTIIQIITDHDSA